MKLIKSVLLLILLSSTFTLLSQDNVDLTTQRTKDLYDKINQKDIAGALKIIDPNCVDHMPFVPNQKPGPEGFRQIIEILFKSFPDFNQSIVDIIVSPDGKKSCVLATMTGTNSGDFMGMPATNKKVSVFVSDIFHFENGKVTDHWGFIDSETLMQQLGMSK